MTAAADLPGNLFHLPIPLPPAEMFTTLVETPQLRIERIVSSGQTSLPDQWYDQDQTEWVVVLQGEAELTYGDGTSQRLQPGGYVLILPHVRHRVTYTSTEPPCIWLAVHWPEP
ncbi:MAG: cupin domain-containing protein [Cyanobacteria bacterium J06638_6]